MPAAESPRLVKWRGGLVEALNRMGAPSSDVRRFANFVEPAQTTGCWLWSGPQNNGAYGIFWIDGRYATASSVLWHWLGREIPSGHRFCRACDLPPCVAPRHLLLLSHRDSLRYAFRDGCRWGHPWTPENTYVRKDGSRKCRACNARRERERNRRARALAE